MKSYKQLISEVVSYETPSKKAGARLLDLNKWMGAKRIKDTDYHEMKHIGKTKSGHNIYHYHHKGYNEFHFHDPKEHGKVDLALASRSKKHKNGTTTHRVTSLVSRDGSTIKADEAYHHLITKHNMHLVTDTQTLGSQAVWRKLAKRRDINIHGFHKGKPVNVSTKPSWDDHEDIYHDYINHEPREGRPRQLVAHKR